jgi:hypothetical protein
MRHLDTQSLPERISVFIFERSSNGFDIDVHRAGDKAPAASDATRLSIFADIGLKLVSVPELEPVGFLLSEILSTRNLGVFWKGARIPMTDAVPGLAREKLSIEDIVTVACRTDHGT